MCDKIGCPGPASCPSVEDEKLVAMTDPSAFLLREVQRFEGITILIGDCRDGDAYFALPRVLTFEDKTFALTGWNSDAHQAYWKVGGLIAKRGARIDRPIEGSELGFPSGSPAREYAQPCAEVIMKWTCFGVWKNRFVFRTDDPSGSWVSMVWHWRVRVRP